MAESIFQIAPHTETRHLAIGVFDGVHLGHQSILQQILRDLASSREAAVLTFEPHPLALISPPDAPARLTGEAQKVALIQQCGVEPVFVAKFEPALRELSVEAFVDQLHRIFPHLVEVAVGPNWRFGHGRKGDAATLQQYGLPHGFFSRSVPARQQAGQPISSTRIREAIVSRQFDAAAAMLGRHYGISGTVVRGDGRGAKLGFPTANLSNLEQMLPPPGVYACRAVIDQKSHLAVMNYGSRPTFAGLTESITEVHVIDFAGDLYGRTLPVSDFRFLREEKRFESVEALQAQIQADVGVARAQSQDVP